MRKREVGTKMCLFTFEWIESLTIHSVARTAAIQNNVAEQGFQWNKT